MSRADDEISAEKFLAKAPLFARLDARGLRRLAELCVPRTYQVGEEIVSEGSTGLGLFGSRAWRVSRSPPSPERRRRFPRG